MEKLKSLDDSSGWGKFEGEWNDVMVIKDFYEGKENTNTWEKMMGRISRLIRKNKDWDTLPQSGYSVKVSAMSTSLGMDTWVNVLLRMATVSCVEASSIIVAIVTPPNVRLVVFSSGEQTTARIISTIALIAQIVMKSKGLSFLKHRLRRNRRSLPG